MVSFTTIIYLVIAAIVFLSVLPLALRLLLIK